MNDDAVASTLARVEHAIADLAALRSADPAARRAMHAVTLTRLTLETFWVGALRPDRTDGTDGTDR